MGLYWNNAAVRPLLLMLFSEPRPSRRSVARIAPKKGRCGRAFSRPGIHQHQQEGLYTPITWYDRTDWYHPIDQE